MASKSGASMERQWQAEDDARTMARYQEILSDKARMSRAVSAARKQARDLNARATAMNKVAGGGKPCPAKSSRRKR